MPSRIDGAIVRFKSRVTDQVVGFGVLVDNVHILTYAHVVNAVLGRPTNCPDLPAEREVLRFEFPLLAQSLEVPPERRGRVEVWAPPRTAFEGQDIAGLALIGESPPAEAIPARLTEDARAVESGLVF